MSGAAECVGLYAEVVSGGFAAVFYGFGGMSVGESQEYGEGLCFAAPDSAEDGSECFLCFYCSFFDGFVGGVWAC